MHANRAPTEGPKSPRTEQMQSLEPIVIWLKMHSKWESHHTRRPNRIRPNVPGSNRTKPDGQTRHRLNLRLAEAAHVADFVRQEALNIAIVNPVVCLRAV